MTNLDSFHFYIKLSFFDQNVRVYSKYEKDIIRLRYIYRHFLGQYQKGSEIKIYLDARSSLYDGLLVPNEQFDIYYQIDKEPIQKWTSKNTPFPPCSIQPLKGRYLILHGAGYQNDDGTANIIAAPSFSGKTSLMIEMVRRNHNILSDDLLFIHAKDLMVEPYPKPVGIRERAFPYDVDLATKVVEFLKDHNDVLAFTELEYNKMVWLIHMDELFGECYVKTPLDVNIIAFIVQDKFNQVSELNKGKAIELLMKLVNDSGLSKDSIFRICSLLGERKTIMIHYVNIQYVADILDASH